MDFVDKTQPVVARNGEEAGGDLDDIEAQILALAEVLVEYRFDIGMR